MCIINLDVSFIIKFKRHKRNETSKVEWVAKTDQRYLGKTSALQGLKTAILNSSEDEIFFRLHNTNSDGYCVLQSQPLFWSSQKARCSSWGGGRA